MADPTRPVNLRGYGYRTITFSSEDFEEDGGYTCSIEDELCPSKRLASMPAIEPQLIQGGFLTIVTVANNPVDVNKLKK